MKRLLLVFIGLMLLSGCASAPYQSKAGKSLAYNIAKSRGAKYLNDAAAPDGNHVNQRGSKSSLGTVAVMHYLGGFSSSIPFMVLGSEPKIELKSSAIFWIPKSMAPDKESAKALYEKIMNDAIDHALSVVEMPEGVTLEKTDKRKIYLHYLDNGEPVKIPNLTPTHLDINKFKETVSPDFLGSQPSWTFYENSKAMGALISPFCGKHRDLNAKKTYFIPVAPGYEFWSAVSQKLPEWIYLYLAPPRHNNPKWYSGVPGRNEKGELDFLLYPVMLSKGEPLYFVSPKSK